MIDGRIVAELSIVVMVVLDADAVFCGKLLKCSFGSNGLDSVIVDLAMDESQSGAVIRKDGDTPVSLFGECSFQLGKEVQFG
jgi:hypothetical protein